MAQWKQFSIFLIIIVKTVISIDYESNACNEICQCDEHKNYVRVSCQKKNINTAENLGAPKNVEFLDLSENRLSSLGNLVFQSYPLIINLTLSHNQITTLYLDSFSNLKSLVIVDLSHNLLEEFDERIFEENENLLSVDMSWNKFMLWQKDRPFIISKSIEKLSLKNSQLNHIYPSFFKNLPNLKKLDLSNNLLITLFMKQFSYSTKLDFLNLSGNNWQCDRDLELTMKHLQENKVEIFNDQCRKVEPVKFERMQMGPPTLDNSVIKGRKKSFMDVALEVPTEKIFPFFNDIFPVRPKTIQKLKFDYEDELEQCTKRIEKLQDQYNELEISRLSSSDVYFIFFIGVAMGVVGIMVALTCCVCVHKMCRKTMTRRRDRNVVTPRRPNSPFMSGVLERPRERRRRYLLVRNNPVENTEADNNVSGSFVASTVEDNPQNVVIAVRPETPPPSYSDIVKK
ncbi:hypothetical protein ACFFRR_002683 [Megaselia abdita]